MKLSLFCPSKPYIVGQKFGESLACAEDVNLPINKRKIASKVNGVCPPGFVDLYPLLGMKAHTGLDLYAPDGWILRAPCDGVVKEIQTEAERGLGVGIITHDKRDMGEHGEHYAKTRQWHGKLILVQLNQEVRVGDPIMLADSTGISGGSHNHFELKPVEYDSNGNHYNVFQDNDFFGAVDPVPFWSGYYAEDAKTLFQDIPAMIQRLAIAIQNFLRK